MSVNLCIRRGGGAMANLLPSLAPVDVEALSENSLSRIDGLTNTVKRRDTGLCGKYWDNVNLPAKRKRISTLQRHVGLL